MHCRSRNRSSACGAILDFALGKGSGERRISLFEVCR
jgi:hypothetical protein